MRLAKLYPDGPLVFGPWTSPQNSMLAEFVRRHIPEMGDTPFGPCTTIGVIRNRVLLGAVVFHEYQPHYRSIMVSYAFDSPRWITREVLTSLCVYAYIQQDVQRICTLAPKKNKRSRRLVEFIGFKLEGCARKGYGNDDAMIYGMLKSECRWIRDEQTPASSARAA